MRRRYQILVGVLLVIVLTGLAAAAWLSHDVGCALESASFVGAPGMKAIAQHCYGPPQVLRYEDVPKPSPQQHEVLVRVRAASVNPLDWHYVRGTPYLVRLDAGVGRPENTRFGVDFAGTVESVGPGVNRFRVGDDVFGGRKGAFAQYLIVRDDRALVLKPANLSFEQAAALPIAATTALQALRDKGRVQSGQKVLINGASGGVGTFAVQIARAYGADVTGICSTRNVDMVRKLGAQHVIDYTREDVTRGTEHFDLIIDTVGNHGLLDYRRILNPHGTFVIVGGSDTGNWLGPLLRPLHALMLRPFVSQTFLPFLAELSQNDLTVVSHLAQSGQVTSVIDRRYPLREVPAALSYLEQGHARGKVVIDVE
jgi:NADPH:quinone reductase-like Zn-dependent oxidoreductase